jgi:hypothetical protein
MKFHKLLSILLLSVTILTIIGCAGHQRIKHDEAFLRIKPAAPLPEAVAKKQPVNLFVNNFLIVSEQEITNITSDYTYRLSLQAGIYKVKALYYASTGWEEKSFKILPRDEQVMIFPDKKAVLKVTLKKDSWGAPVDKVTYFDVSYEPIEKSGNEVIR